MKKPYLLLHFLVFAANCVAQETKTISIDKPPFYLEKVEVLKSDQNIRQGTYLLTTKYNGATVTTGFYKNNKKDSVWCEYGNNKIKIAEGSYKNDEKVGEWIAYNDKGSILSKYDYAQHQLTYYKKPKTDSTATYLVVDGANLISTTLDHVPVVITGLTAMWRDVSQSVLYPGKARENGIDGTVMITFKIDETGKTSDYRIEKKLGYGCDEAALHAVEVATNKDWVPAVYKGKIVSVVYKMPVNFHLARN